MSSEQRLFSSAKVVAGCTLLSRITGLARDIVINAHYGQTWVQDAFNYGFLIPNLFRRLFGEGALSAVFVPVFTEVLDRDGKPAAGALLGRVCGLLVLVLSLLTILLEAGVLVVWWCRPGEEMRRLMLGLTAVMLPFMISICMVALFSSILNCMNHFAVPALVPIILNVCNMIGVLLVGPAVSGRLEVQVYGVAGTVLVASVLQVLTVLPVLRRYGVAFRPTLDWADANVRRMVRTFVPIMIGQGVLLLNVYFDSQICTFLTRGPEQPATFTLAGREIAYPLRDGALSAINNAQRLYQFPLGVLAISLATAAFPLLSRHAARGDMDAMRRATGSSFRMAVFEGLPAGLLMIVLAEPIVTLLFQYHRFGPEATVRAAWVLRWYGVGMWAFCAQHIVTRGFYSLKDTLTPMWIGCGLVVLTQAVNLVLVWHPRIREAAFGISTSITATLQVLIGLWILRKRMGGRVGARELIASCARTLTAGLLAAGAAYLVVRWVSSVPALATLAIPARAARVFVPMGAAGIVYLAAARLMGMREVSWLFGRVTPDV